QHDSGQGARYTRGRGPVELRYRERCKTRGQAQVREAEIERLPASAKRKLARATLALLLLGFWGVAGTTLCAPLGERPRAGPAELGFGDSTFGAPRSPCPERRVFGRARVGFLTQVDGSAAHDAGFDLGVRLPEWGVEWSA